MVEPSDHTIAGLLRERGLRVTPQRRAIWRVFADGETGHLTAEETLRRAGQTLPELSRGTVYNALAEFVAAGLLSTFESHGSQLYESNVGPHHHFRCRACDALVDVRPRGVERLRFEEPGVVVESTQILFEGLCAGCAAAAG